MTGPASVAAADVRGSGDLGDSVGAVASVAAFAGGAGAAALPAGDHRPVVRVAQQIDLAVAAVIAAVGVPVAGRHCVAAAAAGGDDDALGGDVAVVADLAIAAQGARCGLALDEDAVVPGPGLDGNAAGDAFVAADRVVTAGAADHRPRHRDGVDDAADLGGRRLAGYRDDHAACDSQGRLSRAGGRG
ncbi:MULTISPECIES: hypothetical protein [unclassified Streptomyces]|uniref:hypothetical protein n=1 Tax=unclassified Streptomyces TaxID=2593676 RepID=UPI000F556C6A|nr:MULTISPECIES: hypothetical protein [unclassified Streptomyces]